MFTMTINQIIDSMCNAFDTSTLVVDTACEQARIQLTVYDARMAAGDSMDDILEGDTWV